MSIDIRIDFENNPNGVFYSGQQLRGEVRLTLAEEKRVRGAYIRIYGKGHCKWSEGSGKNKTTYFDDELYLEETTYLVGSKDGDVNLMPGTQIYNFQCNLPNELPTSVEGDIGYIRYTARVKVDIPLGFDTELKRRFTVIHPLNLNDNPQLREPITVASSEEDCCSLFCCCMTPIEVSAHIPVAGYTPGQNINIQMHVTHTDSPKSYEFSVKLMKQMDYYAEDIDLCCDTQKAHTDETQCITKKEASCRISNTTSVEIVHLDLQIPPVPPTDISSSHIVKVTYFLKIKSSTFDGRSKNVVPITIGTYPFRDFVAPNSNATAPITDQPTAPLLDSATGNSLDNELPTYEEALDMTDGGGKGGGAGGNSGESFKPRYPVFKRTTSYSS